jgi:hypothetical protein
MNEVHDSQRSFETTKYAGNDSFLLWLHYTIVARGPSQTKGVLPETEIFLRMVHGENDADRRR